MLTFSALGGDEIGRRLARGLTLSTGPFRYRLQSTHPAIASGIAAMYADFAVEADDGYRDFHVRIHGGRTWRRWWRPQARFDVDSHEPFLPLPSTQAYALLEWGMNWCLATQAHHHLLLHAAALERNGRCIVLPGEPGAGKSTLSAALMLSGWRLLSDEMTVIDRDDGALVALARPVSLKNASIDLIRRYSPDAVVGQTAVDTHKGSVSHLRPSRDSVARAGERGRAAQIVFPRWRGDAATRLDRRERAAAFMDLARCCFNFSLLGRTAFELATRIVDDCGCWQLEYARLDEAVAALEEIVA